LLSCRIEYIPFALLQITDDILVEYPSGSFQGRQSYLEHQLKTKNVLSCCCASSTVSPDFDGSLDAALPDPLISLYSDSSKELTLPIAVTLKCSVRWSYEAFPAWWTACCCVPLRKHGTNTFGFRIVATSESTRMRICFVKTESD
jgi:hypothetical protein